MSFRLAWCPLCNITWNYDEPIPEYDLLRATTGVRYGNTCPRCGCLAVIYSTSTQERKDRAVKEG